jgi:hypothetical protein
VDDYVQYSQLTGTDTMAWQQLDNTTTLQMRSHAWSPLH